MTTRQTPDAVREAYRQIAAHIRNGDEPLDAMTEALVAGIEAWKVNDADAIDTAMRIGLERIAQSIAALDSRAGDAGERKELFLVSLALSKPFAGGTTYSMSQSWRIGGTEQEAIDAAIMFAAKEKPGFGVWNMLIARVPLSATPAPAVDAVPAGEVERLARIRTSMALLQQNSEGCAQNHYGDDAAVHGMPGWLVDTKADLDAFTKILARREADCG